MPTRPATQRWFFPWLKRTQRALYEGKISANAFTVLVVLSQHADHGDGRNARPGLQRLSEHTHLAPRTVSDALRAGEAAGLIRLVRRGFGNAGAGSTNVYAMNVTDPATASAAAPASASTPANTVTLPSLDQTGTELTKHQKGIDKKQKRVRPKAVIDWQKVGLAESQAIERGLTELDFLNFLLIQEEGAGDKQKRR